MSDIFNPELDAFESLLDDRGFGEPRTTSHVKRTRRLSAAIFNDGWDEAVEQSKYLPTTESLRKLRLPF